MTNNQRKYIQSLQQKKFRQNYEAFLVEGAKNVVELLNSDFSIEILLVTPEFHKENKDLVLKQSFEAEIVSETELDRLGSLQSNNAALAVAKTKPNLTLLANELLTFISSRA